MSRTPKMPTPGTDNDRMLHALQVAHPDAVWDLNSKISVMAHSRASELRKLGWEVESVRKTDPSAPKGTRWGWVLKTPTSEWPAPTGPRPVKVIRKARVVA